MENIEERDLVNYSQVCAWENPCVTTEQCVVDYFSKNLNSRVKYLETLNNGIILFAIHKDDINYFAHKRFDHGIIRWIEDAMNDRNNTANIYPLYCKRYMTWEPYGDVEQLLDVIIGEKDSPLLNKIKIELQTQWFSIDECSNNKNKLYVFGDNTIRKGNAGQAVIRNCENSVGIATKINPGMKGNDFMSDNEEKHWDIILSDLTHIYVMLMSTNNKYDTIVFPHDGIGTGLSKMPTKCPKIYNMLIHAIYQIFGIRY